MSRQAWRYEAFKTNSASIKNFCERYELVSKKLNNGYQIRIGTGKEWLIDVYPVRLKWCWLANGSRGQLNEIDDLAPLMSTLLDQTKLSSLANLKNDVPKTTPITTQVPVYAKITLTKHPWWAIWRRK